MWRSSSTSLSNAVAHEAAVARQRRRLVVRSPDSIHCAQVRQIVELADQAAQQRRLALGQQQRAAAARRASDRDSAIRSRGPAVDSAMRDDQPLEILDRLQRLAHLAALGGPDRELLDGVEAIANRLERGQRAQQPGAQQPAAHRRDRAIDLVEQRSLRGRRRIDCTISRCLSVVGSISRPSANCRSRIVRTCASSAFCVSRRWRTSAPPAHTAAWRRSRPKPSRPVTRS